MKKLIPVLMVISCICNSYAIFAQSIPSTSIGKIVIDPGHGGHDPGALSPDRKLREKDINLSVARYLGGAIRESYPDIEVLYTRSSDVAVDLDKRGMLATEGHADLFISIHVNSTRRSVTVPLGPETWVFGGDRSMRKDDSYEVVLKENEVIKFEENYRAKYEGFDPENPQSMIVFNFQKDAITRQSKILATCIQQTLRSGPLKGNSKDRGMKEGGLMVLAYCSMPAILVELGFINSASDRKILGSDSGRKKLARQLFLGFDKYYKAVTQENNVTASPRKAVEKQYRVQVMAGNEKIHATSAVFKGYGQVDYIECPEQKYKYKYTIGNFDTPEEAQEFCTQLRSKDFPGAFVIAVQEGKQVPVK